MSNAPNKILAVVCAAAFFGVLNASAVTVVLPAMGEAFDASAGGLGWVMSLFLLTYGVAIPLYGRLSDRYGVRTLYLFGLALFGGGSFLCALAPNLASMLAARVVQALGGAAFPGLGMTLASRAFPPQRRGVALGAIAATMGVGAAVGPLAGGVLTDVLSWRLLFGISGMAVLIIPLGRAIFPREAVSPAQSLGLPGGAMLAVGTSGALFALAEGSQAGWSQPHAVGALLLTVAAFVGLGVHQSRVDDPFLPRELLRNSRYRKIVVMGFMTTGSYLAAAIGFPLLLTRFNGLSASEVGLVLVPGAVMTAVVGVVAGKLVDRYGARLPTFVGATLMVVVMLGLSMAAGRSPLAIGALAGVLGGAYSLLNTPLAATITNLVRPKVLAAALSLNIMVFFVGGSFGTTLFVGIAERHDAAPGAWNPFYAGAAGVFSDAFLVLALPMMLTALLALTLGRQSGTGPDDSAETGRLATSTR